MQSRKDWPALYEDQGVSRVLSQCQLRRHKHNNIDNNITVLWHPFVPRELLASHLNYLVLLNAFLLI